MFFITLYIKCIEKLFPCFSLVRLSRLQSACAECAISLFFSDEEKWAAFCRDFVDGCGEYRDECQDVINQMNNGKSDLTISVCSLAF